MCSSISSVLWQIRMQFFHLPVTYGDFRDPWAPKIWGYRLQLFQSAQDHSPEFWGRISCGQGCFVSTLVRELAFEVKNIFKPMLKPTESFGDPAGIRRIPGICSESDWTFGPKTDMQGALDARPSQKTIKWAFNLEHGFSMISQTRRSHLYTSDTEPSVYFNRYKTMAEPSVTSKYLADTWLREELPLGSSKFGIYRLQFLLHRSK